jgi:VanZ family protein
MSPAFLRPFLRAAWVPAIIGVIVGSLLPPGSAPLRMLGLLPLNDKAIHALAYAILAFLPIIHERREFAIAAALGVMALGIGIEFIQPYWGRNYEVGDMVADGLGIFIGALAAIPLRFTTWMRRLKSQDLSAPQL